MPGVANVAFFIHEHVVRSVVMLVKIVFCLKEFLVSATFTRPDPFFFLSLVFVLVLVANGGAIYLRDILAGDGTAQVRHVWWWGWAGTPCAAAL